MSKRSMPWLVTALLAGVLSTSHAQDVVLKYDIDIPSALQMGDTTYVLPPGGYVLEQYDEKAANLFALRKKGEDGVAGEPLAILDAWQVPFYKGTNTTVVRMRTEQTAGGAVPVITGWEVGLDYWRLRDVVVLDEEYFQRGETS